MNTERPSATPSKVVLPGFSSHAARSGVTNPGEKLQKGQGKRRGEHPPEGRGSLQTQVLGVRKVSVPQR